MRGDALMRPLASRPRLAGFKGSAHESFASVSISSSRRGRAAFAPRRNERARTFVNEGTHLSRDPIHP